MQFSSCRFQQKEFFNTHAWFQQARVVLQPESVTIMRPFAGNGQMRNFSVSVLVICAMLWGSAHGQQGQKKSANDSIEWKAVADRFMSELVGNRIDKALDLMEPEFTDAAGGEQKAKEAIEGLFAYCGRPLDSEFKHEEHGFKQYLSGRRKEMRKFYYASATNQYSKGVCFFAVEVVPADGSHRVTTFGPLKLQGGQLPDWLK
jgi:hypothetical protein